MPLVVEFSPENADKIFDSKIRKHFIFMSDKDAARHHEMMKNVGLNDAMNILDVYDRNNLVFFFSSESLHVNIKAR